MNMSMDHAILMLPRHADLKLRDAVGATLTTVQGSVWITLDGDTRDVVLGPGESFVVDRQGLTLVRATELSRLRIEQSRARTPALLRWIGRHWPRRHAGGRSRNPWCAIPATMIR